MYGTSLFTSQPIAMPPRALITFSRLPADRKPIAFRRFVLLPGARALLRDGSPVTIGARAFDLLLVLLRARGSIVGKREIVECVWPSTVVDEGNLRFQMATLRKVLGDDRNLIKTVTGRGYLLVDEREDDPGSLGQSHFSGGSARLGAR